MSKGETGKFEVDLVVEYIPCIIDFAHFPGEDGGEVRFLSGKMSILGHTVPIPQAILYERVEELTERWEEWAEEQREKGAEQDAE